MTTYLITGGQGFIGRALANELRAEGVRIRVLDALVGQVHGTGQNLTDSGEVEFIHGDVRDPVAVRRALDGVNGVFHLAAEVGVGQSMYEISRYVGANDLGTAVLLEELIDQPVPRLVVASSMSVYGEGLYQTQDGRPVGNARRRGADVRAGRWEPVDQDGRPPSPCRRTRTSRWTSPRSMR